MTHWVVCHSLNRTVYTNILNATFGKVFQELRVKKIHRTSSTTQTMWFDFQPSTVAHHLRAVEGACLCDSFGKVFQELRAKKYTVQFVRCIFLPQRLPTFPGSCPPSIIGTTELNYCVRYGYRCVLCVIITEFLNTIHSHLLSILINSPILWSSPRPISIGQLNTLLHLHLRPINHVVYMGSY